MANGAPGADSSDLVTSVWHGQSLLNLANQNLGQDPVLWGRYFKGPGNPSHFQYQAPLENAALRERNIKLLPIARQTNHVSGDRALGTSDAQTQVDGLIAAFGIQYLANMGADYFFFLDTEPGTPLSAEYYAGWSETVVNRSSNRSGGGFTIHPCIYLNHGDDPTCRALNQAVNNDGAPCSGAWVAHYVRHPAMSCVAMPDWDDAFATPLTSITVPILLLQFTGDCYGTDPNNPDDGPLDCNQVNPNIDLKADLLDHLILPPPT
jgi:hypothetical protein